MATSSFSLDKWRDDLRDIDFWLRGYRRTDAYDELVEKMYASGYRQLGDEMYGTGYVHWNVGVGPAASFTRAISAIALEALSRREIPFDHVIKVELMEPTPTEQTEAQRSMRIEYQLALLVAEELGLLDQQYSRRHDDLRYYTYGMDDGISSLEAYVRWTIAPRINEMLSKKRYLLAVEILYKPINLRDFSDVVGLPPPLWTFSRWVISTTSVDVYDRSKSEYDNIYGSFTYDGTLMIILSALHQSAQYIFNSICQGDEWNWEIWTLLDP